MGGAGRSMGSAEANPQALKFDLPTLERQAEAAERASRGPEAMMAYLRASMAARELGERAKAAPPRVMALLQLTLSYKLTRQEERVGALLTKGAELVKQVVELRRRLALEASLLRELGLYYAGTLSVVTTLWKINDRASYELMHEFYANLKTMNKAEALRQAQLKVMKEFPQPFFWAAFQLTGEV